MIYAHSPFSKNVFFRKIMFDKYEKLDQFHIVISLIFITFSTSIFASFFHGFFMKKAPKMTPKNHVRWDRFLTFFATLSFMLILC